MAANSYRNDLIKRLRAQDMSAGSTGDPVVDACLKGMAELFNEAADALESCNGPEDEGYPSIAHDFEKMRETLAYIARLPNDYPVSAIADRAKRALPTSTATGGEG